MNRKCPGQWLRAGAACAVLAALSACAAAPQNPWGLPGDAHKITVEQRPESLTLALSPAMGDLTLAQQETLRGFAAAYLDHGYGPLAISVPEGSNTTAAGHRAARQAQKLLHDAGLDWAVFAKGAYQANETAVAPLMLGFTRYVAHAKNCGGTWHNLATHPGNNASENFGCFLAVNTAAMIANPYDLVRPSVTRPPSAERRQTVMDKYTAGKVTSAARSKDAKGTVSDVSN